MTSTKLSKGYVKPMTWQNWNRTFAPNSTSTWLSPKALAYPLGTLQGPQAWRRFTRARGP